MYRIELTDTEKSELKSRIKNSPNPWLTKRYQAILMRNDELSTSQIANYVSTDINTITNWVKMYLSGGLTELGTLHLENRRESVLEPLSEQIESYIDANEVVSIKQLACWLLKEHQLAIDQSWLRKWCKKKDLVIKRLV